VLVCIVLISAFLTFAMNWLALIPWRRAKDKHWSERARLYHPARVSAASNLWVLPAVTSVSILLWFPENGPHWAFTAFAASVGAVLGTIAMDREVRPRVGLSELCRLSALNWVIRFLMWFIFLGAAALMPSEFNYQTVIITLLVLSLLVLWTKMGWLQISRCLGLMAPPPERLTTIVKTTAAKMNIPVSQLLLMRSHSAQAFALPGKQTLLFSERLVEILTDEEISAVCVHELAHLTESRSDYYKRHVVWLMFIPWIFLKPMIHTFGVMGFYALLATTLIAPRIFRRVSHKLEVRADSIAHANEPDPGVYARALAKLYEDNLAPAVNSKKRATHPHLYDRLLAAGVTPDFPRPKPTAAMSWNGIVLSAALGILAGMLIFQVTDHYSVTH